MGTERRTTQVLSKLRAWRFRIAATLPAVALTVLVAAQWAASDDPRHRVLVESAEPKVSSVTTTTEPASTTTQTTSTSASTATTGKRDEKTEPAMPSSGAGAGTEAALVPASSSAAPGTTATTTEPAMRRVEGQRGRLFAEATMERAVPAGRPVKFTIRARDDRGGNPVAGVDFGDGTPVGVPERPIYECAPPPPGTMPQSQARMPKEKTFTFEHSYRNEGRYTAAFRISTGDCEGTELLEFTSEIEIMRGEQGRPNSNGPRPPEVSSNQMPPGDGSDRDPTLVHLGVTARDGDGYVSRVSIDWGDGTASTVREYSLMSCNDSQRSRWPTSYASFIESHRYATPGTKAVTIEVTSVGCDGKEAQVASVRAEVAQP